ncbi:MULTISPECIES: hypothetical protein [Reichenbachiella]|uniref:Leucine rich repeat-containing protein n=1 Tax=Reichenbachiella agariperforans TaxID=156994 RepID=A0A1M6PUK7_REIAG|nr:MULTISPECIES: hypothetical protein [Reichenbachiella]RJE72849.1 hypothetical protein BGP76_02545 [Reichenbachiella sp. MSK19-1]SHK11673.1 hypothetical protein SAMN04488028_10347 [Reichenbachiella agariperforans]
MKVAILLAVLLPLFLSSCAPSKEGLFDQLNEPEVTIYLSEYDLDSIPPEINALKDCQKLKIMMDTNWQVYPPLSQWSSYIDLYISTPPFHKIPSELCELTQLKSLTLVDLNLTTLPSNLDQLTRLEKLNLSMNKLDLKQELSKLDQLPMLTELVVTGNKIDTLSMKLWILSNPQVSVIY